MSSLFSAPPAVLLHIPTRPYYRDGFDTEVLVNVDYGVFALCQIAALAYYVLILVRYRALGRRFVVPLGILLQVLASGALMLISAFATLLAFGLGLQHFVLMPPAIMFSFAARPDEVPETWMAAGCTFLLTWGICRILLIPLRGLSDKGMISLIHAGVMHPIAFPIGQLIGLMHAIYVVRTARRQHGG